jgi:hypothetical protein
MYCLQRRASLEQQDEDPALPTAILLMLFYIFCIRGEWRPSIMKSFIVPFSHIKSFMYPDTISEEHKIMANKYILNNMKTVTWGFHHVIVDEPAFWVVAPCG